MVTKANADKAETVTPKTKSANGLSGDKIKVKFHKNPNAGGSQNAVYVGLNGFAYAYQFEQEVEVPAEVLDIIDNAMIESFEQATDKGDTKSIMVKRFPYSVMRK